MLREKIKILRGAMADQVKYYARLRDETEDELSKILYGSQVSAFRAVEESLEAILEDEP